MIHNKLDEAGNVKIKVGDLATLVVGNCDRHNPEFVDAIYLGAISSRHGRYPMGNSHLFTSLEKSRNLKLYTASSLKMEYWSDGDDEPSYAVGITAFKSSNLNLRDSEMDYLRWLISRRETT